MSAIGIFRGPPTTSERPPRQQSHAAHENGVRTVRDENRAILCPRATRGFALLQSAVSCGLPKDHNEGEDGVMRCASPSCNRRIGLVCYRRGWFDKRRFCSKKCRE
jgi:hypothetical protein